MSIAIRGNDFNFFFHYQKAKNRARTSKMDSKIDTFWAYFAFLAYLPMAYLPFHNFFGEKLKVFFFFFLMSIAIRGNDYFFFH